MFESRLFCGVFFLLLANGIFSLNFQYKNEDKRKPKDINEILFYKEGRTLTGDKTLRCGGGCEDADQITKVKCSGYGRLRLSMFRCTAEGLKQGIWFTKTNLHCEMSESYVLMKSCYLEYKLTKTSNSKNLIIAVVVAVVGIIIAIVGTIIGRKFFGDSFICLPSSNRNPRRAGLN